MAKPNGLEMMPEAIKIRKIREMELEIDSLKGRILKAVVEFDKLQEENADLVAALEKIANPPISPPSDKADRSVDIAEQALTQVKGDQS